MAKAKTQQTNTSATTTPPTTVPPSSCELGTTHPSDCSTGDSNSARLDPLTSPSTALESSHNISISSIDQDDQDGDGGNDSSVFESSDSECDDEHIKQAIERIPRTLQPGGGQLLQNGTALMVSGDGGSPSGQIGGSGPNIGSIAVQNSTDITFGNKTYIKGQVVIKNIYHDRQNGGVDNKGYNETDGEMGMPDGKKDPTQPPKPLSWRSSLKAIIRDKPLLSVIILVALIVVLTTIIVVVILTSSADEDFLDGPRPLRIVTRNEWLAQPPRENLTMLALPVHRVIIAHTATEECKTQAECIAMTKRIQQFHMSPEIRNWSDIGYNFLVGGEGNAYEGRGWDFQGAHTKGFNTDSICIAFIGTFTDISATVRQISAAEQLIAVGVTEGKLDQNYRLFGHRQLAPFDSPGRMLFQVIKRWPHWSNETGKNQWTGDKSANGT